MDKRDKEIVIHSIGGLVFGVFISSIIWHGYVSSNQITLNGKIDRQNWEIDYLKAELTFKNEIKFALDNNILGFSCHVNECSGILNDKPVAWKCTSESCKFECK